MKNNNKQSGFTLIEVLLYLALATTVLFISTTFLLQISQSFIKQRVISEVTQQSTRIIDLINTSIRNGVNINTPTPGNQSETLSIETSIGATNPTVYSLDSGVLYISEGGGSNVALTNNNILISNLNFRNLSQITTTTTGTISVYFDTNYINDSNRSEYSYQESYFSGATLRNQ